MLLAALLPRRAPSAVPARLDPTAAVAGGPSRTARAGSVAAARPRPGPGSSPQTRGVGRGSPAPPELRDLTIADIRQDRPHRQASTGRRVVEVERQLPLLPCRGASGALRRWSHPVPLGRGR